MASNRNSARIQQDSRKRLRAISADGLSTNVRLVSGLLKSIRELPADGVVEMLSSNRHHLQEAVDELWSECGCQVELEISHGKFAKWECSSFSKVIIMMVRENPGYREALVDLWKSKPCTQSNPYNLIIYGDELIPGNILCLDQSRKLFGCQGCIKDFGPAFIRSDSSWIPLFCIRHTIVAEIPGGMSYVMRMYLRQLLLVEKISTRGILVPLDTGAGHNAVLYFKVTNLVGDGDALRMLTNWKGAKAKLPCFFCLNVLGVQRDEELPEGCVQLSSLDKSSFARATNADWWSKADELSLQQPVLSQVPFAQLQVAMGLNWNEKGLLWDKELRHHIGPIDVATYDAMHTMLVEGVGQDELTAILEHLRVLGDDWSEIRAVMRADWKCCHGQRSISGILPSVFSRKREQHWKTSGAFAPTASEMLAVFPVFGYYLQAVAVPKHGDELKAQLSSYLACASCIALCKEGKEDGDGAAALTDAMLKHAEQKDTAYPGRRVRAKDHWRHHIGDQMARDGMVLPTDFLPLFARAWPRLGPDQALNPKL